MHPNAKTSREIRNYIQRSDKTISQLSSELGVSRNTVRKWKSRNNTEDRSHLAINLKTTLDEFEECFLMFLRLFNNLSIDDMLIIAQKFLQSPVSRSALGRMVKRKSKRNMKPTSKDLHGKQGGICYKVFIYTLSNNDTYILILETRSKLMECFKVVINHMSDAIERISNFIKVDSQTKILVCRDSSRFNDYYTAISRSLLPYNIHIESYDDHCHHNDIEYAIMKILEKQKRLTKYQFDAAIRIFLFIYNYKTNLRSLRGSTPADVHRQFCL